LRLLQDVGRLKDVTFAGAAALVLGLCELKGLLLLPDVGAGDRDQLLGGADSDIGCRDVTQKRDQNVVITRDRSKIGSTWAGFLWVPSQAIYR
jgi:hypothetical protein